MKHGYLIISILSALNGIMDIYSDKPLPAFLAGSTTTAFLFIWLASKDK